MDIRKYFKKETQKEQSDKSSGEKTDTEESLCHAEKNKTFMTCPASVYIYAIHGLCKFLHGVEHIYIPVPTF